MEYSTVITQLIRMVIKSPDSTTTKLSEENANTQISTNQLGNEPQLSGKSEWWIFMYITHILCQGFDSSAVFGCDRYLALYQA